MSATHRNSARRAIALLSLFCTLPTWGQTLTDFGFGILATGSTRRMLVVLADFETAPAFAHTPQFYDGLIFNSQQQPSVNGYYNEVSNGRFLWTNAAIIGPIHFSSAELGANFTPDTMDFGLRRLLYHSNLVHRAMSSGLFDFAAADLNHDGTVVGRELVIVVISNDGWENMSNRDAGRVAPPGSPVAWQGLIVRLWHQPEDDFSTTCHEIAHSLGTVDLYGIWGQQCLNTQLTLMGCTGGVPPSFHLDPWHKMLLGWCEPRLVPFSTGGVLNLPAAQLGRSDAPVLLFDPGRLGREYFLIEYRTQTTPNGPGYDNNVSGNGMVLWHLTSGQPLVAEGSPSLVRGGSVPWKSGVFTPYLLWSDGSWISRRIHVMPFTTGAASITVEVGELPTWADFNFPCTPCGDGTFDNPYNRLGAAVLNVPERGIILVKTSTSSEMLTINKSCILKAYGGASTIGK